MKTRKRAVRVPDEIPPQASMDPILEELQILGWPVTRENYLLLMLDDVPKGPLDPELEMQLPPKLRSAQYRG